MPRPPQLDLEGALAAKDAIIDQLRRELEELHARLGEADRKYQLLNTTTAAELVSEDGRGGGRGGLLNTTTAAEIVRREGGRVLNAITATNTDGSHCMG